jgi:hypothetical protein
MGQVGRMEDTEITCRFVGRALIGNICLEWHNGDGKGVELVQNCIKWQYYHYHFWFLVISLVRTFFFSVIYFIVVTYIAHEVSFKLIDLLVI